MAGSVYVLDANVFIEAARRYYAFDLITGSVFWDTLAEHSTAGTLRSIDRVREELRHGGDALWDWVNDEFSHAFTSTDEENVVEAYRNIMDWVSQHEQYFDAAKAEFAAGADGWLVAYAKVNRCTVVTQEVFEPDIKRKVKIPNICNIFQVNFVDTFEMLRQLASPASDLSISG